MALIVGAALSVGCGNGMKMPAPTFTTDQLQDPDSCTSCHQSQHAQWSTSMHAYSSDDPVFRAMNQRGQRETNGALGSFCVNCHAPLAVRLGMTTDGLNLDSLPAKMHGVTCFYCHSVASVTADHDNPLTLATDGVLRAGISNPFENTVHGSGYSKLVDREVIDSASMCGSCHDVVTPAGVALERTYHEWQGSVFALYDPTKPTQLQTCGKCHMSGTSGQAANVTGAPTRLVHSHLFEGVDTALTDFPGVAEQQAAIANDLLTALSIRLCVAPSENDTAITITLDNVSVGHDFPSGASQDRRAWVELIGYQSNAVIYSSGVVAAGQDVTALNDPDLWLLRDQIFDTNGMPAHMFWDAASYKSTLLPPSVTNDQADPRYYHAVSRNYTIVGKTPDRVTTRVRLQAIGLDVIADLIASGDLDPSYATKITPVDLGDTTLEWTMAKGYGCVPQ